MEEIKAVISFGDIFWPVLAAFGTATLFFEAIHFLIGLIAAKRQLRRIQEQAQALLNQGGPYNNNGYPLGMFDINPDMFGGGNFPSTVSGSRNTESSGNGNYI